MVPVGISIADTESNLIILLGFAVLADITRSVELLRMVFAVIVISSSTAVVPLMYDPPTTMLPVLTMVEKLPIVPSTFPINQAALTLPSNAANVPVTLPAMFAVTLPLEITALAVLKLFA